jgi:glycosyltransferase involved in cell wall biosynthesis
MRPRICLAVPSSATERRDVIAARLRGLLEGGWDARLLCRGEQWTHVPALDDPALASRVELMPERDRHVPPRSLLARPGWLVRSLRTSGEAGAFHQRLLKLRPDLVHFHSLAPAWKLIRLKELLDCRVVVSFREDGRDLENPHLEMLWEGADLLLFPDEAMLERAIGRGCPPERAESQPLPLPSVNPAMDGCRPHTGPLRVVSAGALTWEQGFEHSVHAVRLLLDMGIECEYRILGEGGHHVAVAFARHQLGVAEHVELVSPDGGDALVEELRASDVFVDPAVTDTISPAPLAAAQALGIPFVSSRRDGLPDDAGIAVPRRDPGAIAAALAALAGDAELRRRLGRAGRRQVDGHPTLEDDSRRLESLYRRVLG